MELFSITHKTSVCRSWHCHDIACWPEQQLLFFVFHFLKHPNQLSISDTVSLSRSVKDYRNLIILQMCNGKTLVHSHSVLLWLTDNRNKRLKLKEEWLMLFVLLYKQLFVEVLPNISLYIVRNLLWFHSSVFPQLTDLFNCGHCDKCRCNWWICVSKKCQWASMQISRLWTSNECSYFFMWSVCVWQITVVALSKIIPSLTLSLGPI